MISQMKICRFNDDFYLGACLYFKTCKEVRRLVILLNYLVNPRIYLVNIQTKRNGIDESTGITL